MLANLSQSSYVLCLKEDEPNTKRNGSKQTTYFFRISLSILPLKLLA